MSQSAELHLYIQHCRDRSAKILNAFRMMHQDVALNYLCGECFFPFLMRAKYDPAAAAHVPEFKEAISSIVGSGVAVGAGGGF